VSSCDVIAGSTKKYKLDSAVKPQNDPVVVGCLLMIFAEEGLSSCDLIAGSNNEYKLDSAVKPQNDLLSYDGNERNDQ